MTATSLWNSHPKKFGPGSRSCRRCGNQHGLIRKYGLMMCRKCFRDNAQTIGFLKYDDRVTRLPNKNAFQNLGFYLVHHPNMFRKAVTYENWDWNKIQTEKITPV